MNITNFAWSVCVCAVAGYGTARAQEPDAPVAAKPMHQHHHCQLGDILGADVRLSPSAEERVEAVEKDKAPPKGPKGEVKDLIVTSDGAIQWAVLSVGGLLGIGDKTVAVPFQALTPNPPAADKKGFTLGLTKAELESRPSFDVDRAKKGALDAAVRMLDEKSVTPAEAAARKADHPATGTTGDRASAPGAPSHILASELKSIKVMCTGDKCGSVNDCFVDTSRRCVEFVTISRGGVLGIGDTVMLVPLQATRLTTQDGDPALLIDKTKQELEAAPKYVKPDSKDMLVSPENAKQAEDFFGRSTAKDSGG